MEVHNLAAVQNSFRILPKHLEAKNLFLEYFVPLDPAATVGVLAHFLVDSEAKLAFMALSSFEKIRTVCERLGRPISVVALRPTEQIGYDRFADGEHTPVPADFTISERNSIWQDILAVASVRLLM